MTRSCPTYRIKASVQDEIKGVTPKSKTAKEYLRKVEEQFKGLEKLLQPPS
jgi:hypothetical protein